MSINTKVVVDKMLDCTGLACPMPIVRTKKAVDELQAGQVIEVQATDKGSLADLKGWAQNTGHQYLGTVVEGELLKHYVRKASPSEEREVATYSDTVANEELEKKIAAGERITILDVREPAEYAFNRIPDAVSIPFGELEDRTHQLNRADDIYVICRTGMRSDLTCKLLAQKGFKKVKNVLPGMIRWSGPTEQIK